MKTDLSDEAYASNVGVIRDNYDRLAARKRMALEAIERAEDLTELKAALAFVVRTAR